MNACQYPEHGCKNEEKGPGNSSNTGGIDLAGRSLEGMLTGDDAIVPGLAIWVDIGTPNAGERVNKTPRHGAIRGSDAAAVVLFKVLPSIRHSVVVLGQAVARSHGDLCAPIQTPALQHSLSIGQAYTLKDTLFSSLSPTQAAMICPRLWHMEAHSSAQQ